MMMVIASRSFVSSDNFVIGRSFKIDFVDLFHILCEIRW